VALNESDPVLPYLASLAQSSLGKRKKYLALERGDAEERFIPELRVLRVSASPRDHLFTTAELHLKRPALRLRQILLFFLSELGALCEISPRPHASQTRAARRG